MAIFRYIFRSKLIIRSHPRQEIPAIIRKTGITRLGRILRYRKNSYCLLIVYPNCSDLRPLLCGTDSLLGDGIYWCEQKKESKNTCSNAPGSVFALKLFKATNDSLYFKRGKELYKWTQKNLQDSTDYLYFDNIRLDGKIGKAKFAYNSGQILYQLTKNPDYLKDAQSIAKECYNYFFTDFTTDTGESLKMLKQGNIWFTAVMLRGFIELYQLDQNKTFIDAFNQCLSYAWDNARDENGLFSTDLTGNNNNEKKWLLTQAAMVEMYSRLATIQ